jgi:hypothetical protein
MRKISLFNLFTLAFVAYILGVPGVIAQTLTGDWTANTRTSVGPKHRSPDGDEEETKVEDPNKIHLSFNRTSPNGGKNQHGSSFNYSDLEGLTRQQAESGGPVRFRLVREAGIIDCEGTFANGKGSGTFSFTANKNFVDAMKARGFDFEKQSAEKKGHNDPLEKLFAATTLNVTTALADDLKSANFGNLDVEDLFKAAIFKVDGKFMAEMKATGFPNLGMEDLVKARIFKVDANYVRQVKDMGFTDQGFEGLVKFRIFKVTPEFLNELKTAGLDKMDAEDIVKARIFKIDGEFIRQARAEEPNITMEELVQMKIGVRRRGR